MFKGLFRGVVIFLIMVLLSLSCNLTTYADSFDAWVTNILYLPSINDNFVDDAVLVCFTYEESIKFQDYSIQDFSEVDCISVKGLSTKKHNMGKMVIREITNAVISGQKQVAIEPIDFSKYNHIVRLKLREPGKDKVLSAISKLQKREDVLFAEPDYIMQLPDMDEYEAQAIDNLNDDQEEPYYKRFLGLSDAPNENDARDLVQFDEQIKIGIIDSGVDASREFFFSVSEDSANFTNYDEYDSEENQYVPTSLLNDKIDVRGHGTHVAGIIASTVDNFFAFGNYNYAPLVLFTSVRVFDENGNGETSNVIAAIDYLDNQEVKIINYSAGGYLPPQYITGENTFYEMIDNFDGVFVCAAGNGDSNNIGLDLDTLALFPAVWDIDNMITVGASTSNDTILTSSNYGDETVDIFAPGEMIKSCYPLSLCDEIVDNCTFPALHISYGYHYLSGTSMATGFVSGVAALVMQYYDNNSGEADPIITPTQVKDIILYSANTYREAFNGKCVSNGRLDAYEAVIRTNCNHSNVTYSIIDGGLAYHNAECQVCHYVFLDSHQWILKGSEYYCPLCRMTSKRRPPNVVEGVPSLDEDVIKSLAPSRDEEELPQ